MKKMSVENNIIDQTEIEQKLLPLLDKWADLLAQEKSMKIQMAELRAEILKLMPVDSMNVGRYHLARFRNFGGYFTKRDENTVVYTLQVRIK